MEHVELRPAIELSWHRSRMSGLSTDAPSLRVEADAVDRRSRLATAAAPILTELGDRLGDAPYVVILADGRSRIVDIPIGSAMLRRRVDGLGGITGAVFVEETTGTNSIATVHELRQGIAVHGAEHYLEPFKALSCYGHPIFHPVTGRLSGVLDMTCMAKDDSPLLGPLIARAARDIEERLLAVGRRVEQHMFAVFQSATSRRNLPVVVIGTGVVLANPMATDLLESVDYIRLRDFAAELSARHGEGIRRVFESVRLASGRVVSVRAQLIAPGAQGVLFEFASAGHDASVDTADAPAVSPGRPVYVSGASGTGLTTTARSLAGEHSVAELDSAALAAVGEAAWLSKFEQVVTSDVRVLIVEHIELLPRVAVARLRAVLRDSAFGVVLTGAQPGDLPGHVAPLAAACARHVELPALTARAEEMPALVHGMVNEMGAGDRLRFTPAALAALAACPWPGNLRELHTVVRDVVDRRTTGDVTAQDLPQRYRRSPRWRVMTPLERAEHDAIVAALRMCEGNKVRAAQKLGISRTTLYSRMRTLHVSA